ncbi:P-loop containing nucleoside triphosphate hydrolase protein [Mucor ambiguus]|uniref:p-loop containing nucleoside triphosphate hydrolase protein n=1 Tax=Mucor ambiguus TaxID=91626 RepID=A0A0C9N7Y0_9FUNG|nr:P-loop containing nucleoside triphosphate hydrolase protein [Mucor ambiguus]
MLDLFTILTKGGFVLWQKTFAPINGSPVEDLIRNVLIEERAGTDSYFKENYALKWTFANELDLVFVVAYQKILQLNYIDELLETVKRMFLETNKDLIAQGQLVDGDFTSFGPIFDQLLQQIEEKYSSQNRQRAPRKFENTKKFENSLKGSQAQNMGALPVINTNTVDEDEITKNIKALKLQASPRVGGRPRKGKSSKSASAAASPSMSDDTTTQKKKKSQKQARVWDGQIAKGEMEALDFSSNKKSNNNNEDDDEEADADAIAAQFVDESKLGQKNDKGIYEVQDVMQEEDEELDFDDEEEELEEKVQKGTSSGLFSYFKSFTGQREMTAETLDPVIATIKEHLITQNVATDIAEHLCQSVRTSLLGKKLGSFERISTAVRNSMETALKRILTPKTSLDILRDIEQAKSEKRPYTMCFIGVNGVGKSTNLSKVCFWLLQNNYKILIAACDTFRSGAVEQLRVHARNLRALQTSGGGVVELFERGYGKDSAGIAKDAINYATVNNFDVVLIDTAGRMQDNEPLMRALSKLVSVNQPDKIIFVGEALVGNEAVDQLTKFNQALKDFSGLQNPRHIDGMILTKFDTIDDKVGAALSMTYITGQPIYFVGTGQTYTDLKNLKVSHVVHSLLKK